MDENFRSINGKCFINIYKYLFRRLCNRFITLNYISLGVSLNVNWKLILHLTATLLLDMNCFLHCCPRSFIGDIWNNSTQDQQRHTKAKSIMKLWQSERCCCQVSTATVHIYSVLSLQGWKVMFLPTSHWLIK